MESLSYSPDSSPQSDRSAICTGDLHRLMAWLDRSTDYAIVQDQ